MDITLGFSAEMSGSCPGSIVITPSSVTMVSFSNASVLSAVPVMEVRVSNMSVKVVW
jgi:hypothetical protein